MGGEKNDEGCQPNWRRAPSRGGKKDTNIKTGPLFPFSLASNDHKQSFFPRKVLPSFEIAQTINNSFIQRANAQLSVKVSSSAGKYVFT